MVGFDRQLFATVEAAVAADGSSEGAGSASNCVLADIRNVLQRRLSDPI